ncbi:MAG: hypothetical protein K2N47_03020, partial [Clostridia bacterium]|nr:hypothetical protein [Clostridia bacterium]
MYHLIVKSKQTDKKFEDKIKAVKDIFERAGKELKVHLTAHAGHAKEIAASLTKGGQFAHLIAMGGDGTLHEVLNGIEDVEQCTLGLIPHGTGNDFAATVKIPKDATAAAEIIAFRAPQTIDYIELDDGLRSINAVGAGIDVDILKRRIASGKSYLKAFKESLFRYKGINFKISVDGGEPIEQKCLIACLGNGKQIGGGIKLFPEAEVDDGYINLFYVKCLSRLKTLSAFMKLMSGKANKIKEATHVVCKSASVVCTDGD